MQNKTNYKTTKHRSELKCSNVISDTEDCQNNDIKHNENKQNTQTGTGIQTSGAKRQQTTEENTERDREQATVPSHEQFVIITLVIQ
jgi:hypothetical protein